MWAQGYCLKNCILQYYITVTSGLQETLLAWTCIVLACTMVGGRTSSFHGMYLIRHIHPVWSAYVYKRLSACRDMVPSDLGTVTTLLKCTHLWTTHGLHILWIIIFLTTNFFMACSMLLTITCVVLLSLGRCSGVCCHSPCNSDDTKLWIFGTRHAPVHVSQCHDVYRSVSICRLTINVCACLCHTVYATRHDLVHYVPYYDATCTCHVL